MNKNQITVGILLVGLYAAALGCGGPHSEGDHVYGEEETSAVEDTTGGEEFHCPTVTTTEETGVQEAGDICDDDGDCLEGLTCDVEGGCTCS